ncbi:MAG: hypothetical protein JNK05_29260 [Myxococcales bacterium]|nr:hypothetical protein [Myxococcales bacterium]
MKLDASVFVLGIVAACAPAQAPPHDATGVMDATDDANDGATAQRDATTAGPECGSASYDAGFTVDAGVLSGLRGVRYCEVLLATLASGTVNIDVYNTLGVSDCPEAAWMALDPTTIRNETMSSMAILNGPRYWTISGMENSVLADPTTRYFGCIPMRTAGRIQLPLAGGGMLNTPYTPRTILRNTTFVFARGSAVYELVDPMGRVFDMQSYSTQRVAQTEDSLASLGARLALPMGWSFRTRVLTEDLRISTTSGMATVVTDELQNTYQWSAQ